MPPEAAPQETSRHIKWNEVTWYSKLLSVIFLLILYPALTFYIGTLYSDSSVPPREKILATNHQPAVFWVGTWILENYGYGNDVLTIEDATDKSFSFSLRTIGGNAHVGEISGVAIITDNGTAVWKDAPENSECAVSLTPTATGIYVKLGDGTTHDPCRDYHGVRAGFSNGIYEKEEIAQAKVLGKVFKNKTEGAGFLETIAGSETLFLSFLDKVALTGESIQEGTHTRTYEGSSGDYSKGRIGAPSYIEFRTIIVTEQSCEDCGAKVWVVLINSYDGTFSSYTNRKTEAEPKTIENWRIQMKKWYETIPKDLG